jgi:zinc transporter 1/2/3
MWWTTTTSETPRTAYKRRLFSPLQGKGMMLLALVLFTESVTLTKAVRSVEAYSHSSDGAFQQQKTCTDTSSADGSCSANLNSNTFNCCAEFEKCTRNNPKALDECMLVPRGGSVAEAATAGAAATVAATNLPLQIPLNAWKVIFQAILTTINVVCWLVPLRSKSFGENKLALSLANAFSGGIFLSLAFGHMIPECVEGFASSAVGEYNEATPYMLVLGGYLLIFFVEKVAFDAHEIMHEMEQGQDSKAVAKNDKANGETAVKSTGRSAMILLAALGVHSILEMMALGLSDSFRDSALLTVSIALHQPAESIALLVAFLKSGMPKGQIVTFLSIFSAMGPIGVALGMAVNEFAAPIVDSIMLAIVAGTFVYVGATEVIPEEWEDSEHKWKKFFALMGGIVSIFAITQYTMTLGM